MSRNPQDFLKFIAKHYRPIVGMYRQDVRFETDDEIASFLRRFGNIEKDHSALIRRMKDVGVLHESLGNWGLPSFLKDLFAQLEQRFTLATPAVINAWIQKLRELVFRFEELIGGLERSHSCDTDQLTFVLGDITDTFQVVNKTVHDNCERISEEVAGYRVAADAALSRQRMRRLIFLYDEYLDPILQLLSIDGEFRNASDDVVSCCSRLKNATLKSFDTELLADKATHIRQDVIWLRRVIVRRAEEAHRELGPLCEAARRESQIAKGVNQCLDAIAKNDWEVLQFDESLPVVEFRNRWLFSDGGIERYLHGVLTFQETAEPTITSSKRKAAEFPLNTEDVLEQLDLVDQLDDLLDWMIERFDGLNADHTMTLFNSVLLRRPESSLQTNRRKDYPIDKLVVDATTWKWGMTDDNADVEPGYAPAENGQGISSDENRASRLPR